VSDAEPDAVLVCLRVSEDSIGSVVAGSVQRECFSCGCRVWLSRSGQALESSGKHAVVKFRCLECVASAVEEDPEILKNATVVPGAVQEIGEHMRGNSGLR